MEKTINELAQMVHGTVVGDGHLKISSVTNIENPKQGAITYLSEAKKLGEIENSSISALIVTPEIKTSKKTLIQAANPKLAWAILLAFFNPEPAYSKKISDQASISKTAKIGKDVTIEPFAVVGDGVTIGSNSVIRSYAFVDRNSKIGEQTVLHPHVVLYANTQVGNKVVIHAGAVIGAEGFGYVFDGKKQHKIPQIGNVVIENNVEIGACSTIDRATVGSTIIREGVKIDNLVQVGHNVEVGAHSCLSSQVGISGSSKIGSFVTMGGRAGLGDHCTIGDQVTLGAQTGVPSGKTIPANQIWIGAPARPYQEMKKQISAQLRSYETQQLVSELKKRIEALEKTRHSEGLR